MQITSLILDIASVVILSYDPAPGQFINLLPSVTDNPAAAAQTALDRGSMVCLGAAGGSLTAAFTMPVVNDHDYDITIYGNAFDGSSEPGIVFVSKDVNHNGIADDPWYEIAGSEHSNTIHNYRITYYRPASDTSDIPYADSQGNTGFVLRNTFHTQPYFPSWLTADSLVFHGSLLPSNVTVNAGNVSYEVYDYGYADNKPNSDGVACSLKLDWALDSLGNPANLDTVHFIRIQTAVLFTDSRQTGELSTEIYDINTNYEIVALDEVSSAHSSPVITQDVILFNEPLASPATIYSVSGHLLTLIPAGTNHFSISHLPSNTIFLLRAHNKTYRFRR